MFTFENVTIEGITCNPYLCTSITTTVVIGQLNNFIFSTSLDYIRKFRIGNPQLSIIWRRQFCSTPHLSEIPDLFSNSNSVMVKSIRRLIEFNSSSGHAKSFGCRHCDGVETLIFYLISNSLNVSYTCTYIYTFRKKSVKALETFTCIYSTRVH